MLWLAAITGMRRNEVLGLQWPDVDFKQRRLSLNRRLVAVGYELHQTRGKTDNARRSIDLDPTNRFGAGRVEGGADRRVRRCRDQR